MHIQELDFNQIGFGKSKRDQHADHHMYLIVLRGATKYISIQYAEAYRSNDNSFDSDGFYIGYDQCKCNAVETYVHGIGKLEHHLPMTQVQQE